MENNRLTIVIDSNEPISITDINEMFTGINDEYKDFLSSRLGKPRKKTSLFLQEVRKGSLIFDLVEFVPALISGTDSLNTIYEFGSHLKDIIQRLKGEKNESTLALMPKKSQKNISKILSPISSDNATQLFITVNGGKNDININLGKEESAQITKNIAMISKSQELMKIPQVQYLETVLPNTFVSLEEVIQESRVLLYWDEQYNFQKGFIDKISRESLTVIFEDFKAEKIMKEENSLNDRAFIVDVEIQTIKRKPVVYKVKSLYNILDRLTGNILSTF